MNVGDVVGDRFLLGALAGKGGMGAVWRATDRTTLATVALKLLRPDVADAPRFLREAEMLAALRDETIVGHLAHGTTAEGELFLAMEWIEGEDLAARLARGALDATEALALAARVARALAVAHRAGVVHRDIKPHNVMLPGGRPDAARLVDFGIARLRGSQHRLTQTGAIIGTPQYMAPEQIRGVKDLEPRVDVYALGCVLFEALTGAPPFTGDAPVAVLARVLLEETPRLRERWPAAPAALEALLLNLLAKDPAARPQDGEAVLGALASLDTGAAAAPPTQSLTGRERRLVSVLVGALPPDVGDDTTLARNDAPTRLRTVAARFEAELELLAEGSFFASFSGGTGARDQVVQAARCALALSRESPRHRVVLATGRAVVDGRTPLGEVVDRAAALLERAPPGVLVDSLTADLLDGRFELSPHADGARLERELDAGSSGDARPLLGRATPFVGRDRELGALEALYAECAEESAGRVALVTAPPGLGKTRLRVELLKRLRARDVPPRVWLARADVTRTGSPFGLFSSALLQQLGHGADADEVRPALSALVDRHLPTDARARVTLFLSELLGLLPDDDATPMLVSARRDPMQMSTQTHRAVTELVVALCREGPLVVVLEDLHWGDGPTVTLVGELLKAARELPLFVLALARPEVHTRFPRVWHEHALQEIGLAELRPRAVERFVREMLGDPTPELVARLVAAAAGNAFFLEELVRAVSRGKGELPGSVVAMAQARLEGLESAERRALRAASVLGEVFWTDAVATLTGDAKAGASLRALVSAELLVLRPGARFDGQTEYAFRHAFLRDAAYAMLTEPDRVAGHRAAAQWLESNGEHDALVLARHCEQGQEPVRAAALLAEAAEQALRAGDLAGAMATIERGMALGATGEVADALAVTELEVLRWSDSSENYTQRAGTLLARSQPGSAVWSQALGQAARAHGIAGLMGARGVPLTERLSGLARLAERSDPLPGNELHYVVALARLIPQVSIHEGVPSHRLLQRLLTVAAPLRTQDALVDAQVLEAEAFVRGRDGRPYLAWQLTERAVVAYEAGGDTRYAEAAKVNVLFALTSLGQARLAGERAAAQLAALQGAPSSRTSRAIGLVRALLLARTGTLDDAGVRKSIDDLGTVAAVGLRHYLGVNLAIARFARRDWQALVAGIDGDETEAPFWDVRALPAAALLEQGRAAEALALLTSRPYLPEMFGAPELGVPHFLFVYARVLDAIGKKAEAREKLAEALRDLRARAADIEDLEWRRAYLEDLPVHVELLATARAWGS